MDLRIRNLKEGEWILLHDYYCDSSEPDSPKNKFEYLNAEVKNQATEQYSSNHYKAVLKGEVLIGFVGFFPDDEDNINLFYVIAPERRGKGYFSEILTASLDYCRNGFVGYKYIRALTRKENTPSIKGLERFSFHRKGSMVEAVQPDVVYEEYLLPI